MAIRINAGTAPKLGRLTMPQGSYLTTQPRPRSNPSTAADGQLGAGGGTLPATPIPIGGTPSPLQTYQPTPAWQPQELWQGAVNAIFGQQTNPQGGQGDFLKEWFTGSGRFEGTGDPFAKEVFAPRVAGKDVLQTPRNSLVGAADIGAQPLSVAQDQIRSMFPGLTPQQVQQTMQQMGYSYQPFQGGGGTWVRTGTNNTAGAAPTSLSATLLNQGGKSGGPADPRGRPEWVDPTQLARGERVTTSDGVSYVGGTPTAEGNAQFARTFPGGVDDERFKWASNVKQLEDGTWVKTYKRVQRAQYTRNFRKKQQQRAEQQAPQGQAQVPQSVSVEPPIGFNQLVNLSADYG
jgi:hypothetical protein